MNTAQLIEQLKEIKEVNLSSDQEIIIAAIAQVIAAQEMKKALQEIKDQQNGAWLVAHNAFTKATEAGIG